MGPLRWCVGSGEQQISEFVGFGREVSKTGIAVLGQGGSMAGPVGDGRRSELPDFIHVVFLVASGRWGGG